MNEEPYTHGGGVVTRRDGDERWYLIVRSSTNPDHWVLPKGHIKEGETADAAALREVREEAGVRASILSEIGESEFTRGDESIRVKYYAMRYDGEGQADEDRPRQWCTYDEAVELLKFEDARDVLDRARRFLEGG